jgi:2-phospho-L-lactate/phosphoenolpyruvate guanylyltransferase
MTPSARGEIWAVVPVKRFDRAKARLASTLDRAERAELAKAMLGDVLQQLARTKGLAGALVVTGDPEAAAMAIGFGAVVVADPVESGTNDAVLRGIQELLASGRAGGVVVAPGDIPAVTADELRRVLAALDETSVALVPAARDGGTNILALSPLGLIAPAFGPDSFVRHVAAASAMGIRPAVLRLDGASHDVDVAADLVFEGGPCAGSRTRACLRRFAGAGLDIPAGQVERASL